MKSLALCLIGAALCGAPACAQSAAPEATGPAAGGPVAVAQNSPDESGPNRRGWRRYDWRNDDSAGRNDQGRMPADDGRDAGPGQADSRQGPRAGMMSHEWRMLHSAPDQGRATFKMRRGNAAMDVSCPAGPDLAACVDAAGHLFDRLDAAPAAPPAPQPAPPPAPAH